MKIKAPGIERIGEVGGGGTFLRNLAKILPTMGDKLVSDGDFDIFLIAGASLCKREEVEDAKAKRKPIVLRVDNILEDCKNRNGGMTKLREFAKLADVIVYQSKWAERLLKPYCGRGMVIYNGVDTDVFYQRKKEKDWDGLRIFFSKFSRNEVKRFHEVQYFWREYNLDKRGDTLVLVGRFADDYRKVDHPFEFHNEEDYEYHPPCEPSVMADIMRSCDLAFIPYYADACSNTVLELQACGLPVMYCGYGGTKELISAGVEINYDKSYFDLTRDALATERIDETEFKNKWGYERMGEQYHALFKLLEIGDYEVGE